MCSIYDNIYTFIFYISYTFLDCVSTDIYNNFFSFHKEDINDIYSSIIS